MRIAIAVIALALSSSQANAQAAKAVLELGKWAVKGGAKAKAGAAATGSIGKAAGKTAAGTEAAAGPKTATGAGKTTDTAKDTRELRNELAKNGAKAYHGYCNSKDDRYNSTNCAAYKGSRETVRMPRSPDITRKR